MAVRKSFGALVRREREAKEIGLREMAKRIGVSPTYLSKIERGDFGPPAEDRVRKSCSPWRGAWRPTLPTSYANAPGKWPTFCGPRRGWRPRT
jgi:hypothetical protein